MRVFLLLLLLALPAQARSPLEGLPLEPPGLAPDVVTSEKVQAALPVLEKLIRETMASTGVPGLSVAVVYQDEVVYLKGFGVREVGRPDPVDADTVFQLASISKPLGSTVISALMGDGVMSWADPISKYEDSFALADPWVTEHVTFADLYSHRSGLPDHAGDLLEDLGFDRAEVLRRLRLQPLDPFRDSYAYTNFGLTQAAVTAASAAGKGWADLSRERLYEPAGMTSTTSRFSEFMAFPNRAAGHVKAGGGWEPRFVRQPDAQSPAGGAASSARDMARWMRLQLGEGRVDGVRVVDERALVLTHLPHSVSHAPQTTEAQTSFYGLGWGVGTDNLGRIRLSHSGAFALGAATCVVLVPQEELGIIVLTNGEPIGVPEAITDSFVDLASRGAIQRDWVTLRAMQMQAALHPPPEVDPANPPAKVRPSRPLSQLVGARRNDYFGPMQVVERGGGLVMLLGPKPLEFPLRHWDGDVFLYEPVGENAAGPSRVTFHEDGSVTVANLDRTGLGTFRP